MNADKIDVIESFEVRKLYMVYEITLLYGLELFLLSTVNNLKFSMEMAEK